VFPIYRGVGCDLGGYKKKGVGVKRGILKGLGDFSVPRELNCCKSLILWGVAFVQNPNIVCIYKLWYLARQSGGWGEGGGRCCSPMLI
jgi:hypothetical protein